MSMKEATRAMRTSQMHPRIWYTGSGNDRADQESSIWNSRRARPAAVKTVRVVPLLWGARRR